MHPVLVSIGPFHIYSWGTMFALAFIVGTWLAAKEARRRGYDPGIVVDLAAYSVVSSLIGARLLYVLLDPSEFAGNPWRVLFITEGGLSLHGGVLGVMLMGIWFSRRYKVPFWGFADILAPSVPLGTAITRIGCFLNGCCYGVLTRVPWASFTRLASGPRHPTQIYEMLLDLVLFIYLWRKRDRIAFPGALFLDYVVGYSVIRFIVEYWRDVPHITPFLSVAQGASLVVIAGAYLMGKFLKRKAGRISP
ncbi:MAG TPA: prolipoprotein diacylglyceryl transferase [Clostridia bacterium]|nr:prolipoprotein diacylglyceryl transferase [Clostridia bacterium]